MYKNLQEILEKKQITMKEYAEFLGVCQRTVKNKIQGKTEFTLEEVTRTSTLICPEYTLEFAFSKKEEVEQIA